MKIGAAGFRNRVVLQFDPASHHLADHAQQVSSTQSLLSGNDDVCVFELRREDIDAALRGIPNVNVLANFITVAVSNDFSFGNALLQN